MTCEEKCPEHGVQCVIENHIAPQKNLRIHAHSAASKQDPGCRWFTGGKVMHMVKMGETK